MPTGGNYLRRQDGSARHSRAASAAARRRFVGNGSGRRRRVRRRQRHRRRPRRRRRRHPAERRARPQGRPRRSTAASSSTTTWRRRTPTSSPSASASSIAASATGWSRRSSSRPRCWRRRSPATRARPTPARVQAAKLKIMGVDVFSAGDWSGRRDAEPVRFEDPRARRLQEARRCATASWPASSWSATPPTAIATWTGCASDTDLTAQRRHLLFPPPVADAGLDIAQMADSATVCGCVGVTKGAIIAGHPRAAASTRCRSSRSARAPAPAAAAAPALCQDLLQAPSRPSSRKKPRRCSARCVPFAQDEPARDPAQPAAEVGAGGARHLRQRPGLRGLQAGAELHARHALVRRSRRGPLGALHQRSRPRQHPEGRHVLGRSRASAAASPRPTSCAASPTSRTSTSVPMVKITGSQRIDLLGVKKADLPKVWADLGMPSGQAYTKGVRMVKTCVGTEFCRFGTQDSTARRHRDGAALREPLHAAQGEDGDRRLPAQLRRGDGEGHRPGRAGRRLAGRRRRRGRQVACARPTC